MPEQFSPEVAESSNWWLSPSALEMLPRTVWNVSTVSCSFLTSDTVSVTGVELSVSDSAILSTWRKHPNQLRMRIHACDYRRRAREDQIEVQRPRKGIETEGRGTETEDRGKEIDDRGTETEDLGRRSRIEVRRPRIEVRRPRIEVRRSRIEETLSCDRIFVHNDVP